MWPRNNKETGGGDKNSPGAKDHQEVLGWRISNPSRRCTYTSLKESSSPKRGGKESSPLPPPSIPSKKKAVLSSQSALGTGVASGHPADTYHTTASVHPNCPISRVLSLVMYTRQEAPSSYTSVPSVQKALPNYLIPHLLLIRG